MQPREGRNEERRIREDPDAPFSVDIETRGGPSGGHSAQSLRSTIIFFSSAMARPGFRPFGQVLAQFMMVWQR
jgi:hypothetical protein